MDTSGFIIRPTNQNKFRSILGKRILEETLNENLAGRSYESDDVQTLSDSLAVNIREKLKGK
uniref:CopG family transcriptional regulator n=1 Tax=Ascaris lumbricoides TaxID=6252 RepID=A0A0M3I9R7_ASCLU